MHAWVSQSEPRWTEFVFDFVHTKSDYDCFFPKDGRWFDVFPMYQCSLNHIYQRFMFECGVSEGRPVFIAGSRDIGRTQEKIMKAAMNAYLSGFVANLDVAYWNGKKKPQSIFESYQRFLYEIAVAQQIRDPAQRTNVQNSDAYELVLEVLIILFSIGAKDKIPNSIC